MNKKELKALFPLTQKVRIYIPSTVNINEPIDNRNQVEDALKFFGELFGGATSYDAVGAWNATNGTLVTESVTIVEAYALTIDAAAIKSIISYAQNICRNMSQDAIALEVNGAMGFIN